MKYEFGSPEWLAALHGMVVERAAHEIKKRPNLAASTCDVMHNAPAHIADAQGRVVWSTVISNGVVDFRREERSDVALKVIADYQEMLPIARYDTKSDPARQAEIAEMVTRLIRAGKVQMVGQRLSGPNAMEGSHDFMARLTA